MVALAPSVEPLLLTASDAARLLAIGLRKLWSLTASHEIPCVRIGRAVRYDLTDLRAWVEQNKSPARR
jgi:excisionase family DNA binding protein